MIFKILLCLLPWVLRRRILQRFYGYEIDPSARIGLAYVYPKRLRMGKSTRIDHFTVALRLDAIELGDHTTIGRNNWITGVPSDSREY